MADVFNPRRAQRRRFLTSAAALGVAAAVPPYSRAQGYPSRPIKIVVPNSAGGGNDFVARLIGPEIGETLGQSVVIENRPGAAGNIGLEAAAKAPADGYTLFVAGSNMLASAHTLPIGIDPIADLEHISMICDGYFIYSINAGLPARNTQEFIALAKREPGKRNYGTPGAGGNNHVSGELFKLRAGVDIVPIHYKVAGAVTAALLSNEIQLAIQTLSLVSPYLQNGRARALFITGRQRDPQLPDVPTSVELGLADLDNIANWFGIYAPKGTPRAVTQQVNAVIVAAMRKDAIREKLNTAGLIPAGTSPEAFRARAAKDYAVIGDTVRLAKVGRE